MFIPDSKQAIDLPVRKKLLKILNTAIRCVQPQQFIGKSVRFEHETLYVKNDKFSTENKRIFVIGSGKASAEMAEEIERILAPERITAGIIITHRTDVTLKKIHVRSAGHPIPSEEGLLATKEIFDLKSKYGISANDIIIALVSGGASALMPYPVFGISLEDKKILYDIFIERAIPGFESTKIKANVSQVKSGGLAKHFFPTPIISLILSDDNGKSGHENTGSGPFTNNDFTCLDALKIIDKYDLKNVIPDSIYSHLKDGEERNTSQLNHESIYQYVLATNKDLVEEIGKIAENEGIDVSTKIHVDGEASETALEFCNEITKRKKDSANMLLYGGETTVHLPKTHGIGGRNQEFAVACLKYLDSMGSNDWCVAAIATDGVDFIKESAGGIIDSSSQDVIKEKKYDIDEFLEKHDSHNLLKSIGSNVVTEKGTGTNVGDIMVYLQI